MRSRDGGGGAGRARGGVAAQRSAEGERGRHSDKNELWIDEDGQDVAEYDVMVAIILVIVVGTIRLVGSRCF